MRYEVGPLTGALCGLKFVILSGVLKDEVEGSSALSITLSFCAFVY